MNDAAADAAPSATELLAHPFGSLSELIRAHARSRPHHPALVHGERTLDYAGLDRMMDRVTASLQRDGVRPGDAVAICAANSIEYAVAFLGGLRAGTAVAPLPQTVTPAAFAAMLFDTGAAHAFVDDAVEELLASNVAPEVLRVALDEQGMHDRGESSTQPLSRWLASSDTVPASVDVQPDWPFDIIYSSGTTGTPKGIVQPHAMRWTHMQRGTAYDFGPDTVTLVATPLHSNTTLVAFFPTLALGGTVVMMGKFDPAAYLVMAQRHKVTHTMLVPVQYQRIMALPDFTRYDLGSFRMKLCTSAPFAVALKKEVLQRWPGGLVEYYGMTEGGGTCILVAHEHPDKLHTVGRPAPGHDIRLIDESGREVARGDSGEVVGHSPGMMTGYHRQPLMTQAAEWFDRSGKRFIRTGDIGRFDDEGFLELRDRRKDMIISGGFNIYPSDLEAVLRGHPEVTEVAVVGVPSQRWGETPVAFVVINGTPGSDAIELLTWANARLGKTQRLSAIELVGALPRSGIGKILKRDLVAAYNARYGQVAPADATPRRVDANAPSTRDSTADHNR